MNSADAMRTYLRLAIAISIKHWFVVIPVALIAALMRSIPQRNMLVIGGHELSNTSMHAYTIVRAFGIESATAVTLLAASILVFVLMTKRSHRHMWPILRRPELHHAVLATVMFSFLLGLCSQVIGAIEYAWLGTDYAGTSSTGSFLTFLPAMAEVLLGSVLVLAPSIMLMRGESMRRSIDAAINRFRTERWSLILMMMICGAIVFAANVGASVVGSRDGNLADTDRTGLGPELLVVALGMALVFVVGVALALSVLERHELDEITPSPKQ